MLDWDSDGRSLEMEGGSPGDESANQRVLSRVTLRLLTWGEKGTGNLLIMMCGAGVSCDLVKVDLEPMCRASVLLP